MLPAIAVHAAALGVYGIFFRKSGQDTRRTICDIALSAVLSALFSAAVCLLLMQVSLRPAEVFSENRFVFFAEPLLFCAFSAACAAGHGAAPEKLRRCALVRACSLGVFVVLLCELFVFSYLSYLPGLLGTKEETLALSDAVLSNGATRSGNAVVIGKNGGTIAFSDVDVRTVCITLEASGNKNLCSVSVGLMDDNFSRSAYQTGARDFCTLSGRSMVVPVYSSGKAATIVLTFDEASAGLHIEGAVLNRPGIFLSFGRFLLLSLLVTAAEVVRREKLWKIAYDPRSRKHAAAIALLAVLLCTLSVQIGRKSFEKSEAIAYPLVEPVSEYGCYIQQFDAFQKSQLNLDLEVDPALAALHNPYDRSQRIGASVQYDWDRSYYNGKYYSYFGVTPIFTVYYPYYWVTGALPTDGTTALLLSMTAILLTVLLVREIALRSRKKVSLLFLLLGMAAAVFTSLVFTLQSSVNETGFYYIASLSGLANLALFLLLCLRSLRAKKPAPWLFAAGIAYVLTVGSRPGLALYGLAAVPLLTGMIFEKGERPGTKVLRLGCFLVPVLMGAAALMAYNAARFGSPFEFGQHYQLTVDDMRCNNVSLLNVFPAIWFYFLQLPTVSPKFPFLQMTVAQFFGFAGYKLRETTIGALSFPMIWSLFFLRRSAAFHSGRRNRVTFLLLIFTAVLLAVLDFSMSGTNVRYTADILPALTLPAVVLCLEAAAPKGPEPGGAQGSSGRTLRVLAAVVMMGSILIASAAIFSNERDYIRAVSPGFYADLERLTMLW